MQQGAVVRPVRLGKEDVHRHGLVNETRHAGIGLDVERLVEQAGDSLCQAAGGEGLLDAQLAEQIGYLTLLLIARPGDQVDVVAPGALAAQAACDLQVAIMAGVGQGGP